MGFRLIIESEAQKEIDDAIVYYENMKFGLGLDFLNYLDGYFQTLLHGKASFKLKRHPVFRELPLKRFPFIIIYEAFQSQIIIYSVFNTFKNPETKKGELD